MVAKGGCLVIFANTKTRKVEITTNVKYGIFKAESRPTNTLVSLPISPAGAMAARRSHSSHQCIESATTTTPVFVSLIVLVKTKTCTNARLNIISVRAMNYDS